MTSTDRTTNPAAPSLSTARSKSSREIPPARARYGPAGMPNTGWLADAGCHPSHRIDAASAAPATSLVKKPTWSREGASGTTPSIGTRRYVGLNPTIPQNDAGRRTEPMVWVPRLSGHSPAATAAAEPLLEPPGVWARLRGLRAGPGAE